jgi:hypothetical protein
MDIDEFLLAAKSGSGSRGGSERRDRPSRDNSGLDGSRKRPKLADDDVVVKSGIMKRPAMQPTLANSTPAIISTPIERGGGGFSGEGFEISEEERSRILQMVEDEPEVGQHVSFGFGITCLFPNLKLVS